MLKELKVEEFVRELASASPTPGANTVAALAGAQAAGLLSMYCSLSQNRDELGDAVERLREVGEESRFLLFKLLEAVDEITIAFNRIMGASRLPAVSEEEVTVRKEKIAEAINTAAEIPLHMARGSLRLLSLVGETGANGNPEAITDLGVANLQAMAALRGACYNLKGKSAPIGDRQLVMEIERETKEICDVGEKLFEENRVMIENMIR